jgi:hypothetical protein
MTTWPNGLKKHGLQPSGKQRPLAVAALEDKIVQRATAAVLNAIYDAPHKDSLQQLLGDLQHLLGELKHLLGELKHLLCVGTGAP